MAIGNFGAGFIFRIAKAGYDAVTGALSDMIFHEQMDPFVPLEDATVTVPGKGTSTYAVVTVSLTKTYSFVPFILLHCAEGLTPSASSYIAGYDTKNNQLNIANFTSNPLTIRYLAYDRIGAI